jgi:ketosteroid isomerase-like protein
MPHTRAKRPLALAGLVLAACQATPAAPSPAWQVALEARVRELEELYRAGNLLGVADIYADDGELGDARGARVRGRAALDAYWSGIEEPLEWHLVTHALRGSEAVAYQTGTSTLSMRRDGSVETIVTDFLVVWRREPDGAWRIELDLYWPAESR